MARLRLKDVADDVRELKGWASRHDDSHTADTKLLASIVESISSHQSNHHGMATSVKQGGTIGLGITLLYVAVELIQRFLL